MKKYTKIRKRFNNGSFGSSVESTTTKVGTKNGNDLDKGNKAIEENIKLLTKRSVSAEKRGDMDEVEKIEKQIESLRKSYK